jgi:glycosyltransferase involved in cell wall biosynthesis
MRVLTVASSYPRDPDDAAGHFVRTGLRGLVARGHTVTVVHPHPGGGAVLSDDAGITRLAVGAGRRRSALAYRGGMPERLTRSGTALLEAPRLVRGLRRATAGRAGGHDVVLSHWLMPGGWIGRTVGLPHVCVLHSGGVHLLASLPFGGVAARRIAERTQQFVAVSRAIRERFLDLLPTALRVDVEARTHVRPNPLPDDAFDVPRARLAGRPLVLFLGRLEPVKGVDVLLDALRPDDPFEVVVAGDGGCAAELRSRARGLPVRFAGVVRGTGKRELLARASAVVVPSRVLASGRTEGAPTVVSEALAAGVPVVGARVGGIPELVEDGVTGKLVPSDDPAALRAALFGLLAEVPGSYERACRDAAARFRSPEFAAFLERRLLAAAEARP